MEPSPDKLIEKLIPQPLNTAREKAFFEEYSGNREINNQAVFNKIEKEYQTLDADALGKLLYLPYSINPNLNASEERRYTELLSSCFINYAGRLASEGPDSGTSWVLAVITDVLFHLASPEKYLDNLFVESSKILFCADLHVDDSYITAKKLYHILLQIDSPTAREQLKQLGNKPIRENW